MPLAPKDMSRNCIVALNATRFFVSIGSSVNYDMKNTYFVDIDKNTLFAAPQMPNKRVYAGCSKIKGTLTGVYNVIVVGGLNATYNGAFTQTLILDLKTLIWRTGPQFPYGVYGSQLVEHYDGGVVVIGGRNHLGTYTKELYYLKTEESGWVLLPQKISIGRMWHMAFLLPSTFVNCIG
jgi:hypothetical protein